MEFYSVEPITNDPAATESLTGYLCRVAARHQTTTPRLLNYLDDQFHTLIPGNYTLKNARSINGFGEANRRTIGALAQVYPGIDLGKLSFEGIGNSFSRGGTGLLKWHRHWCPMCFSSDMNSRGEAYDRLLWQTAEIEVCPTHGCLLQNSCLACGNHQHRMPSRGKLDSCHRCGAWLGKHHGTTPNFSLRKSAYQKWLCKEIPALFEIKEALSPRQTYLECGAFIKAICRTRKLTPRELANNLGISYEKIAYTYSGKSRPKLSTWLQVCARLNISPALTLFNPIEAANQLPLELPVLSAKAPKASKSKNKRTQFSPAEINEVLDIQLAQKAPDYPSIKSLAKANQITESAIYYHAKPKATKLAEKLKNIRHKNAESTRLNLIRHGVAILIARHQEGLFTNRKTFILEMKAKTGVSQRKAKDFFPVCSSMARPKLRRYS